MKIIKQLFILFSVALFASYSDSELEQLWSQIEDINHPTIEDYLLLENYLINGKRPYLDYLRNSDHFEIYQGRMERIYNFRLVSPNNIPPTIEHIEINNPDNRRCILLYSSSNGVYPKKARRLLREIENSGYSGHVLLRIGGFPDTEAGGLKLCHIPYSFKVAFLMEAKRLGFEEVLWIDLAIHPLIGFETVFSEIGTKGYFFTTIGSLSDNSYSHLPDAAEALNVSTGLYPHIPHISSSMLGLNLKNKTALDLLDQWHSETEKLTPCMTFWPEELSLSVIAWRLGCHPYIRFQQYVCAIWEQFQLENRPTVEFYIDGER